MFVLNKQHLQGQIFTTIEGLPKDLAKRLEEGWAAVFYREYFSRIDEQPFAVLYSRKDSRPNIPVNVLVGLEALKSGFNWSDEEMYDAFCFDLQVRRALGYRNLHQGQFDLRTVYNFRRRLSDHMQNTGENLIEKSFEQVTDEQIEVFKLKTGKLRMDSTDIASNIRNMSRLHLLVEVIQRVHRMLGEKDRELYTEAFAPFMKGSAGQYVYRVKSEEGPAHMHRIGELMGEMLGKLADAYGKHATYRMLQRVFAEHFLVEQSRVRLKVGKEVSSRSLNSPDDPEATYRTKNNRPSKGYLANVSETCDPSNPLQLIVMMQTKPNVTNDDDMLVEAVPSLKVRLGVDEINTDGGYNSDESFKVLRDNGIRLIQTAIRGHSPHEHLGLHQFEIVISLAANASDAKPSLQESSAVNEPDAASKSAETDEPEAVNEPQASRVLDEANEADAADDADAKSEPYVASAPDAASKSVGTDEPEAVNELQAFPILDAANNAAETNDPDGADDSHAHSEPYAVSAPDAANKSAGTEAVNEPQQSRILDAANNGTETDKPDAAGEAQATDATPPAVVMPATSECTTPGQQRSMTITCPHGQTVELESVESKTEYKRYRAHFDEGQCVSCPFRDKCLARETKTKRWRTLSFDERDVEIAGRRRRIEQDRESGTNVRAAIESTIASLKQPFNYDQLPVRGMFRVGMVLVGCAAMANIRRIHRFVNRKGAPEGTRVEGGVGEAAKETAFSFLSRSMNRIMHLLNALQPVAYAN